MIAMFILAVVAVVAIIYLLVRSNWKQTHFPELYRRERALERLAQIHDRSERDRPIKK